MIAVIVAEDHVGDGGEIELQLLHVLPHGVGPCSCIEEDAAPTGFDKSRETPFADALRVSEHGGEYGDADVVEALWGLRPGGAGRDEEHDEPHIKIVCWFWGMVGGCVPLVNFGGGLTPSGHDR